jgi:hypothetical protein
VPTGTKRTARRSFWCHLIRSQAGLAITHDDSTIFDGQFLIVDSRFPLVRNIEYVTPELRRRPYSGIPPPQSVVNTCTALGPQVLFSYSTLPRKLRCMVFGLMAA